MDFGAFSAKKISPLVTVKLSFMGVCFCICMHVGLHSPFTIPIWYLSDKTWRYGFKQYEEVPIWHTYHSMPISLPALNGL